MVYNGIIKYIVVFSVYLMEFIKQYMSYCIYFNVEVLYE